MHDFVTAVGLVLVIEGLFYALFPNVFKSFAAQVQFVPDRILRVTGLAALGFGVFVVWLVRG